MKPSRYNILVANRKTEHIVYNTLSAAIVLVDREVKNSLETGDLKHIDAETLQTLVNCNIVVEDRVDERKIFSYSRHRKIHSTDTIGFTIVTTYACNLQCPYCYEGAGSILDAAMDNRTAERVLWFIHHVASITNCRKIELGLFGGEPLLNSALCLRMLEEVGDWTKHEQMEFSSWMFTNGTLLSDEIVGVLSTCGTGVRLTLDGTKDYHDRTRVFKDNGGTYDIIMGAIQRLVAAKIDVFIRIQVVKENWRSFSQLFVDLKKRGFLDNGKIKIGLSPVMALTNACRTYAPACLQHDEIADVYAKVFNMARESGISLAEKPSTLIHRMNCGFMNDHFLAIDPFGNAYKCIALLGQEQYRVLSIAEHGVGKPTFEFYDFMSRDPLKVETCRECVYLPICNGGCAVLAKVRFGTYHAGDCSLHKKMIEKHILDIVRARGFMLDDKAVNIA